MADVKELGDKLAGFSISDKVEEMRRRLYLKKKDLEAHRENANAECQANDRIIQMMRHNNKMRRIILSNNKQGDSRLITSVLEDNKYDRLRMLRHTASKAIDEMSEKTRHVMNSLNKMRDKNVKKSESLKELTFHLKNMKLLETKQVLIPRTKKTVTQLENDLDKAKIKQDMAKLIARRYKDILEQMETDNRTLPYRLDTLDQTYKQQKLELKDLQRLYKAGIEARDLAKIETQQVEKDALAARKRREKQLTALRIEVDMRKRKDREATAERDKKAFKIALLFEQQDSKAARLKQEMHDRQQTIISNNDSMQKVLEAAQATDVREIVQQMEKGKEIEKKLNDQIETLEATRDNLRAELAALRTSFHDCKFSGEEALMKTHKLIKATESHVLDQEKRFDKAADKLERHGTLLTNVKVGVATLLEKLSPIKLKPPESSFCSTGDVFEEVALCKSKIERLLKEVENATSSSVDIRSDEFQGFLERQIPEDNIRVRLEPSLSDLSEFDYETQDNEVLGRVDIKGLSQKLIDSKERRVKMPKKKKK